MPDTESLQQCASRIMPLWRSIASRLHDGETVLIVAHANSIRSLLKHIDGDVMTDAQLMKISIPTAIPLIYDFESVASSGTTTTTTGIVDDGCDGGRDGGPAVAQKDLRVKGVPTLLGMRGRYLASKDLLTLLDHKVPTSGLPKVRPLSSKLHLEPGLNTTRGKEI